MTPDPRGEHERSPVPATYVPRVPHEPIRLQRAAGNHAVAALVLQRKIGDAGQAAVGRGAGATGRRPIYTVVKAEQDSGGAWKYTLKHNLLGTTTEVSGDDAYDLAPAKVQTPEQAELATYIQSLKTTPAKGTAADLLQDDKPSLVATGVGMGEQGSANGPVRVLWSGGAGDCVIVAAFSGGHGWITHADRTAPSPARIADAVGALGSGAEVYLASKMFEKGDAADSELVAAIIGALRTAKIVVTAIYPVTSLAVDVKSGLVLGDLSLDEQKSLKAGGGWEALADRQKEIDDKEREQKKLSSKPPG